MNQYLGLLREVMVAGLDLPTGAKLKDGSQPFARTLFGKQLKFDLTKVFPMVTTKRVSFHNVAHELLWFLSGSTSLEYLHKHNVHIWDEWSTKKGKVPTCYGKQWRDWRQSDISDGDGDDSFDQVTELECNIETLLSDPASRVRRRLIIQSWEPQEQAEHPDIPVGCHSSVQFFVYDGKIGSMVTMRSVDLFLGLPYNIASYALLTHMLGATFGLTPAEMTFNLGDAHIYHNHLDQVTEQITRDPKPLPKIAFTINRPSILEYVFEDFQLLNYESHPAIKGEIAV